VIKYDLTALALKGFSYCKPARGLYRDLGNSISSWKRATRKMPGYFFERVERNVGFCRKYGALRADDLVLELGTGWVHWEALALRLFFDFQAVRYDVLDNPIWCENPVQYINRIQRGAWLRMFTDTGLSIVRRRLASG
jgi:hypothetical protein